MGLGSLFSELLENWSQHIAIICCTIFMFILQRRRARRIFRLQRETVVLFTKYPEAGKAKTRLKPALGDNGAARAQLLMTDHMVNRLIEHQRDHRDFGIDVFCSGGTDEQLTAWFSRRGESSAGDVSWHKQSSGDLGHRMKNAVIRHISQGEDRVVIIGGDIPSLTGEDIEEAMSYLREEDRCDMVLGEASDGGYYLVGLNNGGAAYVHELFLDIPWSTDQVYKQQFAKALKLGLRLRILKRKYSDVDRPEDLPVMLQQLTLTKEDIFYPRWSVIIPALNEGANITNTLDTLIKRCSCKDKLEVIVVDGGSTDKTQERVLNYSKLTDVKITLVESQKGRGPQSRAGANLATGFYLLFLHADALVPHNFDVKAEEVLLTPGTSGGAFRFGVDGVHVAEKRKNVSKLFLWKMQMIEAGSNLRSHYRELPYGDQGLFMTRPMYKRVGGFPAWPLMEDFHLVEKLQTQGHVIIAGGEPMICSSRRWEKHGPIKVMLMNTSVIIAYKFFRVSPERLAEFYYGKPKKKE